MNNAWSVMLTLLQAAVAIVLGGMAAASFIKTDQRDVEPVRAVPVRWESSDPAVMLASRAGFCFRQIWRKQSSRPGPVTLPDPIPS